MRNIIPERTTDLAVIAADYDWRHVFACANNGRYGDEEWETESNLVGVPSRVEGAKCDTTTFFVTDVAHIYDASPGENDGPSWQIVGLLNDGRCFFIEAGCDYTGWDCHSSGSAWVADDLASILRWGMTDEARERLPGVHAAVVGGAL